MITVDLDLNEKKELGSGLRLLMAVYNMKYVFGNIEVCRTKKGYHLRARKRDYDDPWKTIPIRALAQDDENRIWFDIKRTGRGLEHWTNTLFTWKRDIDYEYTEECYEV
jgi:sporulation-control protein spo0M